MQTLKPFIDEKYRTLPDREHTFIAGSSMGGLITFMVRCIFRKLLVALVSSPLLSGFVPDLLDEMKLVAGQHPEYPQHLYFYGAKQEDEKNVGAHPANHRAPCTISPLQNLSGSTRRRRAQ
ncbi:MAG: hypothetical protein IPO83_18680 [Chitinophagaceae bacterium]|nr:hypothetical protein [Chitinophagaceae bacterium]